MFQADPFTISKTWNNLNIHWQMKACRRCDTRIPWNIVCVCSVVPHSLQADCRSPGSSLDGTFQARILEWVTISYSAIKEWNNTICSNIDGLRDYHTKWTKSERERQIPYDITYTWYPEKAMAPHSGTLAWKIPWTEEPGGLKSTGSLRVEHDWATSLSLLTFLHWRRKWQHTPVFLTGESQGWGSLVGCHLWGRTELDTTEAT